MASGMDSMKTQLLQLCEAGGVAVGRQALLQHGAHTERAQHRRPWVTVLPALTALLPQL